MIKGRIQFIDAQWNALENDTETPATANKHFTLLNVLYVN